MKEKPILFQGDMIRAILEGRKTETRQIIKKQPMKGQKINTTLREMNKCPYGQVGDRLWVRETFKVGAWRDQGQLRIAFDYRASPELVNTPWCYPSSSKEYTNQILKAVLELDKKGIETVDGGPDRIYKWEAGKSPLNWKPSIFMPRWASRINLEITEIKVERVQDIGQRDVLNEGMTLLTKDNGRTYKFGMADSDGLPGNDDYGWQWQEWEVDHKKAFFKLWDSINKKRGYSWDSNPWVWVIKFRRIL